MELQKKTHNRVGRIGRGTVASLAAITLAVTLGASKCKNTSAERPGSTPTSTQAAAPPPKKDCITSASFKTPDGWEKVKVSPYGQALETATDAAMKLPDPAGSAEKVTQGAGLVMVKVCAKTDASGILHAMEIAAGNDITDEYKQGAVFCSIQAANQGQMGALPKDIRKLYEAAKTSPQHDDGERGTSAGRQCRTQVTNHLDNGKGHDMLFPFPADYASSSQWKAADFTGQPHFTEADLLPEYARQQRPIGLGEQVGTLALAGA